MTSAELIAAEYDRLKEMSLAKNRAYGDTALNPINIFSRLSGSEAIRARLDDKLARHKNSPSAFGESELDDLIGYLVLLNIAERQEGKMTTETITTRHGFSLKWDEGKQNVRWIVQPRPDGAWMSLEMPAPMPHWWYRFWQRVLMGWRWEKVEP